MILSSFSVKAKWIIWLIMQNQDYQGQDTLIVIFNQLITNPISSSIQTKEGLFTSETNFCILHSVKRTFSYTVLSNFSLLGLFKRGYQKLNS